MVVYCICFTRVHTTQERNYTNLLNTIFWYVVAQTCASPVTQVFMKWLLENCQLMEPVDKMQGEESLVVL